MSIIFISCSVVASAESGKKLFHIDLQSVVEELPKGWIDNMVKEMIGPGGPDGGDVIPEEDLEKYQNIFRFLDPRRSRVSQHVDENWIEVRLCPIWTIPRSVIFKSWNENLDQIDRGWHFLKFGTIVAASEPDQQRNRHIFHDGNVLKYCCYWYRHVPSRLRFVCDSNHRTNHGSCWGSSLRTTSQCSSFHLHINFLQTQEWRDAARRPEK